MQFEREHYIAKYIDIFCCPRCGNTLSVTSNAIECSSCETSFSIDGDIPLMFYPNEWSSAREDVTEKIKTFYEETPFPDYDEFDNVGSLIAKARQGVFARLLDEQIPFRRRILEVGCGTGQLAAFLSIANRTVFGTDICVNSLSMAHKFKSENALHRAHFLQMNLFRPCFKPKAFDVVIANGVLHHTSNPLLGFQTISKLVRPKGYLIVGLYHRYGRIFTDFRRMVFGITKGRFRFLDPRLTSDHISYSKRKAWFMDQYKNPHESKHTIGEVLGWLDMCGLTFIKSIPKTKLFEKFDEAERLFEPDRMGNRLERLIIELSMAFSASQIREGGFFVIIGRRSE